MSLKDSQWIWCQGDDDRDWRNSYVYFRREFDATEDDELSIEITADSAYQLFLNGDPICRGPARSTTRLISYDQHHLPSLEDGRNVLSVIVHYVGKHTYERQLGKPGLIAALLDEQGETLLVTDDSWRAVPAEAWSRDSPEISMQRGFTEDFDARRDLHGWQEPDYDAGSWPAAQIIGPYGMEPWTDPRPRDIPMLTHPWVHPGDWDGPMLEDTVFNPQRVVEYGACGPLADFEGDWAERLSAEPRLSAPTPASLRDFPREGPLEIPPSPHGAYIDLDFERELSGHLGFWVTGVDGAIEWALAEQVTADGKVDPHPNMPVHLAGRYHLAPIGLQHFESFIPCGARLVRLVVRGNTEPIRVAMVYINEATYPTIVRGSFLSSDPLLNRIWEDGHRTVTLCMDDAYMDCPTRERAQWIGDVLIEAAVAAYVFGDSRLTRRCLYQVAESQDELGEGGMTSMCYPQGIRPSDSPGHGYLPTWGLYWIFALDWYCDWTGDRQAVEDLIDPVERLLDWFERHRTERDLLEDVPGWIFLDWVDGCSQSPPVSTGLNCYYVLALRMAARLAELLGQPERAQEWRRTADAVSAAVRDRLWDAERGLFVNGIGPDVQPRFSETVNLIALWTGVVPDDQREAVLDRLDAALAEDAADPANMFTYFMRPALQLELGAWERALDETRDVFRPMALLPNRTVWENRTPHASLCHGWSAFPAYYLPRYILGVAPAEPGFARVRIEPLVESLTWAKGLVPLPQGTACVNWRPVGDNIELNIGLPADCPAELRLHPIHSTTRITVNGDAIWQPGDPPDITIDLDGPTAHVVYEGGAT